MELTTFSMSHAFNVEFGLYFLTAMIFKNFFVSLMPNDLSALPELLEFENVTHGGLPMIMSVSGNSSILFVDLSKSKIFVALQFKPKLKLKVSIAGCQLSMPI